jgi:hypothetical protein
MDKKYGKMKIHERNPEGHHEWFKLEVINIWDWKTEPICFKKIKEHIISYSLVYNTRISENQYSSVSISELNDEMKEDLIKMGYSLK